MTELVYVGTGEARHDGRPLAPNDRIEVPDSAVEDYLATGLFTIASPAPASTEEN